MTTGKHKYTAGFIGIGKMGFPMASRIAAHGYPLHAYAISAAAIKEVSNRVADARAARTPAEIGRSWVRMISLSFQVALGRVPFSMTRHLSNGYGRLPR